METRPIIVGGCHRSGTSLVRRLLNAHSRIHCGPEVKFFRDFYGDYPNDTLRHLRYSTTARALAPEAEVFAILGPAFIRLHERAAALAGKPRWADKNPENMVYLQDWARLLGSEWVLVHVVRHPLDTLASMVEARFPLTLPADLSGRIAWYREYTQAGLDFGAHHPRRYFRVVYERLVEEPRPAVEGLMDWLGERFEPAQLAFHRAQHQTGLEDPKISATRMIHRESIGKWAAVLSRPEARRIWQETRDLWRQIDPAHPAGIDLT